MKYRRWCQIKIDQTAKREVNTNVESKITLMNRLLKYEIMKRDVREKWAQNWQNVMKESTREIHESRVEAEI